MGNRSNNRNNFQLNGITVVYFVRSTSPSGTKTSQLAENEVRRRERKNLLVGHKG